MKIKTKIWLWIALVLSIGTTFLNLTESRWLTVAIAVVALSGLCLLLFKSKRLGYRIMCVCAVCSCMVGIYQGVQGGTDVLLSVVMSFIGSALIPAVTFFFIRGQNTIN